MRIYRISVIVSSFCILTLLLAVSSGKAQTMEAHYKMSKDIFMSEDNGSMRKLATVTYDGYLYQSGSKFISFKRPTFLADYPNGFVTYQTGPKSEYSVELSIDTLQGITYRNFDSMCVRYRIDIPGKGGSGINVLRKFNRGNLKWDYMDETKDIGGLKCQKAQFVNGNGKLQWVVWFCPDLPVNGGPDGITDVPGLVVEGSDLITDEKFVLDNYKTNTVIPEHIFWPEVFSQPFK